VKRPLWRSPLVWIPAAAAVIVLLIAMFRPSARRPDDVAATVNGEKIYERDLARGLPPDAFGSTLEDLRDRKLFRLVDELLLRQFLIPQGVSVSPEAVQEAVAAARQNPPSTGCPCCRYASLEQYLEFNHLTLDEYAGKLRDELALKRYAEIQWRKKYASAEAEAAAVREQRSALETQYRKLAHILFKESSSPLTAEVNAQAVLARLKRGESFAVLARELSADKATAAQGGSLGYVSILQGFMDQMLTDAVMKLEVGENSGVLKSFLGYHIFRREALSDSDILELAKACFLQQQTDAVWEKIRKEAKIVYADR
jgi:parvulin-like peptidyl-prolyl isomerase